MTAPAPLSPETVTNLVQLRALLDSADKASLSNSYVTRPMAVVLLDAVNERATHFAATYLNLTIPNRAGFEQLMEIVKGQLGARWVTGTWPDIRRLHRTRNLVQHEGLEVDQKNIATWAAATSSYTRSLASAVWDININEVTLANAVKHDEIRKLLDTAERKIKEGMPGESLTATSTAFDLAYKSWKNHYRRRIPFHHKPMRHDIVDQKGFKYLEEEISEVSEMSLAVSLAGDPGEYVWFRDLTAHEADMEVATLDEAQRALGFAFGWVIRWEAFQESFIPNRRIAREQATRRVRKSRKPASVHAVKVAGGRENWRLTVELADVPPAEEFDTWQRALTNILNSGNKLGPYNFWSVTESGNLEIWISKDPDRAGDLAKAVSKALLTVEEEIRKQGREREASLKELKREAQAYAQNLEGVSPTLPSWVREAGLAERRTIMAGKPESRLRIILTDDSINFWQQISAALQQHSFVESSVVNWQEKEIGITPELEPAKLYQVLLDISPEIEEFITQKKSEEARMEGYRTALENRLREAFRL
ncbi:hypothetical protein [Streptomyces sp. A1499]|uniref:hypothetical protein n=1 Tax=Streptomyces sp. A1499 TaxID=2563104 RepID=UPI00109E6275|nr:hypothetical protein [Streptomyces sp. A1499]THC47822.1 hypothetical protein E7X58_26525 [Streptomyces sp. A1499]